MSSALDLAIIGSGPAGLSAAITASKLGLQVQLIDEQVAPGGQIYRGVENSSTNNQSAIDLLGSDYQTGAELVSAFRSSAAHYTPNSKVWNITSDGGIDLVCPKGAVHLQAKRILIAAGAMERPMPIPGWVLPGVMTAGSAQIQMKSAAQVPDVPVVIAGSGPLLYLVAWQLLKAQTPLKAVLDTTPRGNYIRAARHAIGALPNARQIRKGLRWIREIKRAGVPVVSNISDLRIEGDTSVESIYWCRENGDTGTIDCQMVLLHQGVVPNYQLASLACCDVTWDDIQLCWRTATDEWGATNSDAIAVAGDCTGVSGAAAARQQGELVALDTAYRIGKINKATRNTTGSNAKQSLVRDLGFRRFLDELYKPPNWIVIPHDDVIVCRCEEVSAGEIRKAVSHGCAGANQLKFYTRAGMGPCQGRMCGLASSSICADVNRMTVNEVGFTRVRPPIRPITIGEMTDTSND